MKRTRLARCIILATHSLSVNSLIPTKLQTLPNQQVQLTVYASRNSNTDMNLETYMEDQRFPPQSQENIQKHLKSSGLGNSETLILLAADFVDRPEVFSSLLISDFGFPPLVAHQIRALAMALIKQQDEMAKRVRKKGPVQSHASPRIEDPPEMILPGTLRRNNTLKQTEEDEPILYRNAKKYIVNDRAQSRRRANGSYEYGLPADYESRFPVLASEIKNFNMFMTRPSTKSQEEPIRSATATVYLRHAKQFLGWYISQADNHEEDLSLFKLIPSKERESATLFIDFILWLRSRDVSVSYEANILRGLTKLLKYRFAEESEVDSSYGGKTFEDIPIIVELRKLHRSAEKRRKLAPRSSDEKRKWISWPEYLQVTEKVKQEVKELISKLESTAPDQRRYSRTDEDRTYSLEEVQVAEAYQRYLILAIFTNIPDRQRTIRELEIGRTLLRDEETGCWVVKHGPDDYKTGKAYGERPDLQLSRVLTPSVDDFVKTWRPVLKPSTNFFFVQSRTGKPLTSDSVFSRVTRCCYKFTGKRTNPHLLRDMIVTHIRDSDASEKELEALALFMGHSITMQRNSYDRRTLSTKIAPAIKLMETMNQATGDEERSALVD